MHTMTGLVTIHLQECPTWPLETREGESKPTTNLYSPVSLFLWCLTPQLILSSTI